MHTSDTPGHLLRWSCKVQARATEFQCRQQRGDVPGWVLVTLMSALLVALLLGLARGAFTQLFNKAMSQVS